MRLVITSELFSARVSCCWPALIFWHTGHALTVAWINRLGLGLEECVGDVVARNAVVLCLILSFLYSVLYTKEDRRIPTILSSLQSLDNLRRLTYCIQCPLNHRNNKYNQPRPSPSFSPLPPHILVNDRPTPPLPAKPNAADHFLFLSMQNMHSITRLSCLLPPPDQDLGHALLLVSPFRQEPCIGFPSRSLRLPLFRLLLMISR